MLRFTERDRKLIVKCAMCRWLTTTQIQRLYFGRATLNAVQKRLRKLAEEGYLRTHREQILSEALHTAGPKGRVVLEEEGCGEFASDIPKQASHLVGVNDIRIAAETGPVPVAYFFAHWQFASLGWRHPVIPDAIFGVRVPARRNFVVEFDRATEGSSVLVAKLLAYQAGLPGFPFEAVIIVTEQDRRMATLGREFRRRGISFPILLGTLSELQKEGFAACGFFDLKDGVRRTLFDHRDETNPGSSGHTSI
jgi:hypothetical protein